MGLATIDPQSRKKHTEIHKISKFGVKRPKSKQDVKICKEMYGHPDTTTQRPDAIQFFVNFNVFESQYLSQN